MSKKNILIIVSLIAVAIYFFSLGNSSFEEENNTVAKSKQQIENNKSLNISSKDTTKNSISKREENISKDIETSISEEKTLIFKSSNQDKSYILSLYSNIEIKEENRKIIKYLPFTVFLQKDGKKDKLSLSLQDSYKKNSDVELSLELFSLQSNQTMTCDASFLKSLEFDYLYYLNIDILDTQISCYIDNKKKLPKLEDDSFEIKIEHLSKERQEFLMNKNTK